MGMLGRITILYTALGGALVKKVILEGGVSFDDISRMWVQFSLVSQLCPALCDPMNRSTPGLPVHHQLLEFTQTHVHPSNQ